MRSLKLLAAIAVVAALVAGPVMAQDAGTATPAPAASTTMTKHHTTKHHVKKHAAKKAASTPATTPAPTETPAQ